MGLHYEDDVSYSPYSGDVVMQSCYERLIKDTMTCPLTGVKLKETDIIPIIRVRRLCIVYIESRA